jgi:hypothetical protein
MMKMCSVVGELVQSLHVWCESGYSRLTGADLPSMPSRVIGAPDGMGVWHLQLNELVAGTNERLGIKVRQTHFAILPFNPHCVAP